MPFSSDLRPLSVVSRIKAIAVLKRDTTKVEVISGLLACPEVVLKWIDHCTHIVGEGKDINNMVLYNTIGGDLDRR